MSGFRVYPWRIVLVVIGFVAACFLIALPTVGLSLLLLVYSWLKALLSAAADPFVLGAVAFAVIWGTLREILSTLRSINSNLIAMRQRGGD
jgi:hypothetical protein